MARTARPWYRKDRDTWCVHHNGKLVTLAKGKANRKVAFGKYAELSDNAEEVQTTSSITGKDVCDLYVAFVKRHVRPRTIKVYGYLLGEFAKHVANIDANKVAPKHLTDFLASRPTWGPTTKNEMVTLAKSAWAWAKSEHRIATSLMAVKIKKERRLTRQDIPTDKEIARFFEFLRPAPREILEFIYETGCRPGEATKIRHRHVSIANREIRFKIGEDKTSAKTGKVRVIHLSDRALAMIERLYKSRPDGETLFVNSKGRAWTINALEMACAKARDIGAISDAAVPYALRHHWATEALARGVPIATVAELMGNSPEIVAKHYSHLSDKKSLLLEAANRVRPAS